MTLAIIDGDVLLYRSIWGLDTLEEAKSKFMSVFEETVESVFASDYVMAFGGPNNFRDSFYDLYKKSNSRMKSKFNKPEWFDDLKSYACTLEGAVLCEGYEADDQVRIWSVECEESNIDKCVVTIDKDLDCIPGKHYYPNKNEFYVISNEYADMFYWQQVLTGDSVDNIPGIHRMGPKTAQKLLAPAKDHKERRSIVCRAYHDFKGPEGYEYLLANGRLIHIWRTYNDHFKVKKSIYDQAIS